MNLYKNIYFVVSATLLVWLGAVTGCTVTTGDNDSVDTSPGDTQTQDSTSSAVSDTASDSASSSAGDTSSTTAADTDTDSAIAGDARGPAGVSLTSSSKPKVEFPVMADEAGPTLDDTRASLRAIEEADIIRTVGDTLYTLSQSSGISIIDLSVQDQLTLLGAHALDAKPFEMYLRGDRMIVLFPQILMEDETGRATGYGSRIDTYNVANPTAVTKEASFEVAGKIIDSRILDNVLFVVSYNEIRHSEIYYRGMYDDYDDDTATESDSDTEVYETPKTTVISLDVTDAANIAEVQRLEYDEMHLTWGDLEWSKKSISISDDRMYVAGPTDGDKSIIQVIDISNPSGEMVEGAQVEIGGAVFNRWQMDEHNGILRVVSQSPSQDFADAPVVQTFTITSSQEITPLGSLTLTLPRAERLRSVRFDEDRAYVITFEKFDPLFVIDLSDPAAPAQVGSLEMPGFVFHMEPRGDRLIGLGFDPDNQEGGDLHVSLFDVSDMSTPVMLSRVYFGPTWSSTFHFDSGDVSNTFKEDQNRIHKLFKVFDDLGLILVPFAGWGSEQAGCGQFDSGVQMLSFDNETLTKNALIGDTGIVRRAFLHGERMLTFSEEKVQSFDITDRDAPVRTALLPTTLRVHRTAVVGEKAIRITSDWNERIVYADMVPVANVNQLELGPMLNLATLLNADTLSCDYHNDGPFVNAPMFVFGNYVAVTVVHPAAGEEYNVTDLIVLDASGEALTVAAQLTLDFEPIETGLGSGIVQVGNALVFQRPGDELNDAQTMQNIVLEVVDMTNPAAPQQLDGGVAKDFAAGTTGLHVTGNITNSGYYSETEDGNVNYYLDRTDFTAMDGVESLEPLLFPGLMLGPLGTDYLGLNFAWEYNDQQNASECDTNEGQWDADQMVCWYAARVMEQVSDVDGTATVLSSHALGNDVQIRAMYAGNERYYLPALDLANPESEYYLNDSYGPQSIVVVGTSDAGVIVNKVVTVWGHNPRSAKMVDDTLYYLDGYYLNKMTAPTVATATHTRHSLGCTAYHLTINSDNAIISCGDNGIRVVPLSDIN